MYQVVCDSFEEEGENGVSFRLASRDKDVVLLKAADYGVPQMRERLFLVGLNNDSPGLSFEYPTPSHGPEGKYPYVTVEGKPLWIFLPWSLNRRRISIESES